MRFDLTEAEALYRFENGLKLEKTKRYRECDWSSVLILVSLV